VIDIQNQKKKQFQTSPQQQQEFPNIDTRNTTKKEQQIKFKS
jgi:hypothetical protein